MRGLRALLAVAALFVIPVAAQAQESVSHFGFSFPLKIGALTRGDVTNFEKDNPGVGYGVRYAGEGVRVDLFVYDLGRRAVSGEISSADQKNEFEASIEAVHRAKERGLYRGVKEGETFESPVPGTPLFRCKVLAIDRGERRVEDSVLCLGARRDKFFKVRIAFMPQAPQVAARADELLREIARAVKF